MASPQYYLDDPAVARVIDEEHADRVLTELADRTVAECLPDERRELPVVGPDATVLEIAALMARARTPLVAVVADRRILGAITLDALLDWMLAA
jgi:CBS domain-containing protein